MLHASNGACRTFIIATLEGEKNAPGEGVATSFKARCEDGEDGG